MPSRASRPTRADGFVKEWLKSEHSISSMREGGTRRQDGVFGITTVISHGDGDSFGIVIGHTTFQGGSYDCFLPYGCRRQRHLCVSCNQGAERTFLSLKAEITITV